jgi:hypothetical protein
MKSESLEKALIRREVESFQRYAALMKALLRPGYSEPLEEGFELKVSISGKYELADKIERREVRE